MTSHLEEKNEIILKGISVSEGIALGSICIYRTELDDINVKFQSAFKRLSLIDKEIEDTNTELKEKKLELEQKNKELEQKIRRTEYKYQDLIENANDLIFTLNLKGDFIFINRRLSTLTGFTREDWMGRGFFDLVAPEDRVEARNNFKKTLQGKARIFEMRMICQNGIPLFLSMNINPIFEIINNKILILNTVF